MLREVLKEVKEIKKDVREVRDEVKEVKEEVGGIKKEVEEVRSKMSEVRSDVDKLESAIEEQAQEGRGVRGRLDVIEERIKKIEEEDRRKSVWGTFGVGGGGGGGGESAVLGSGAVDRNTSDRPSGAGVSRQEEGWVRKKRMMMKKAGSTLGFNPIDELDIKRQEDGKNKEGRKATSRQEAEKMAVSEFLLMEMKLKIEEEDMEIVRIFSPRREGSEVLYVEFARREDVRKIYRRAAVIKNRKANLINYIPPELFERYRAAESLCYQWRKEEGWKTKIMMGEDDIQVMRKKRGDDRYKEVDMGIMGELPSINLEARQEAPAREMTVMSPAIGRIRGARREQEESERDREEESDTQEEEEESEEDGRKRKEREGSQGESPILPSKKGRGEGEKGNGKGGRNEGEVAKKTNTDRGIFTDVQGFSPQTRNTRSRK